VETLRSELDLVMQPERAGDPRFYEYHHNEAAAAGSMLFHALGAWRVSPAFHDLVFLPSIIKAAEALLGPPVRLWHDQLFVKPPKDGAVVEWHQDYSYWTRTKPIRHLTCWIGLDDSTEENGCVQYVPGSHEWELLPRYPLSGDMSAVFGFLSNEQMARFDPVPAIMKAGEASFHHPLMVHGSYANMSDRPRRGCVINFIQDGVRSDSDEPLLAGVPVIPNGEKIAGKFFPLLSGRFF
jgi:ectoine hydroxylase-related dioxygenase (phytanoyl-CoA dioxygenase family)